MTLRKGGAFLAAAIAALAAHTASADAAPFRAMVVHPVGNFAYHTHDLDWALERNGIEFQHYPADDPAKILGDLDSFDMVMCTPLVNLNNAFPGGQDAVREWVGKGRALVITDACDCQFLNPWLGGLLPDSPLDNVGCFGVGGVARSFVLDASPPHVLRVFPERLDHESRQWHCLRVKGGWETVATCSGPGDPHPVTVMHELGRGVVYVSSMQQRWRALPANLRANLALRRLGFGPVAYEMADPAPGPARLTLALKSLLENPPPIQLRLGVSETAEAGAGPSDARKLAFKPDAEGRVAAKIPFAFAKAGPAFVTLEARTPATQWATVFSCKVDVPPALSVLPPRYRGALSAERRTPDVLFEVARPGTGRGLKTARVAVFDPAGRQLGVGAATAPTNVPSIMVPVPLPKLPAGEGYVVKAIARLATGRDERASTNFVVRAPGEHPGDTIVDEDGTLLVDGKPFFPLGVYHLYPDAYAQAAELGFNTVQTFQWMTRNQQSLNTAQALGLKVIFEKNDKTLAPHGWWPPHIRNHPALLMWYAPDEPLHEPDHAFAMDVDRVYRTQDPWHPVIRVNYNPPRFAMDALGCDILSPYNYCLSSQKYFSEQDFWKIWETLEAGKDAAARRKPLFSVQQAFGFEDFDSLRVSAWIALTMDVRGIVWYAWDECDGKTGLVHNPSSQDAMRRLLAQLRELTPALVAPVRRPFTEGGVRGIVCRDGGSVTMLVVNTGPQAAPVPQAPEFRGRPATPLFDAPDASQPLAPLEARAYRASVKK